MRRCKKIGVAFVVFLMAGLVQAKGKEMGKIVRCVSETVCVKLFTGEEARTYVDDIARLRMTLFKEYPYLYEGILEEEKQYLEIYFKSKNSQILLVFEGEEVVGFSNNIPLEEEMKDMQEAFSKKGLDPSNYLYIGEAMLMPAYRHQGLVRVFSDMHDKRKQELGGRALVFMTVERPEDHPMKPSNYRSLEPLWEHYGFHKMKTVGMTYVWPQVDTHKPTENSLIFWEKR